jgi:multidrug efflux pump subunit AcrA (membrane-fusion protein)
MEMRSNHLRTLGKEIDMRTGNVLLLLLLVLIGFGFLLYYSIDLTRELTAANDQLAQAQAALQTLEAQYQALAEENQRLLGENSNLAGANASLLAQLTAVENERLVLAGQVNALQAQLAVIEEAHPVLAWLASSSPFGYAFLIFVPAVPITFGVVYAANHKRTGARRAPSSPQASSNAVIHAALTPEEFQLLVQRRKLMALRRLPARQTDESIVG